MIYAQYTVAKALTLVIWYCTLIDGLATLDRSPHFYKPPYCHNTCNICRCKVIRWSLKRKVTIILVHIAHQVGCVSRISILQFTWYDLVYVAHLIRCMYASSFPVIIITHRFCHFLFVLVQKQLCVLMVYHNNSFCNVTPNITAHYIRNDNSDMFKTLLSLLTELSGLIPGASISRQHTKWAQCQLSSLADGHWEGTCLDYQWWYSQVILSDRGECQARMDSQPTGLC